MKRLCSLAISCALLGATLITSPAQANPVQEDHNQAADRSTFGTSIYPNGTRWRPNGHPHVFIVISGDDRHVPSEEVYNRLFCDYGPGGVSVYQRKLPRYTMPFAPDTRLVKGSGPKVYLVGGALKRWISSEEAFNRHGFCWKTIQGVSDDWLNGKENGSNIN